MPSRECRTPWLFNLWGSSRAQHLQQQETGSRSCPLPKGCVSRVWPGRADGKEDSRRSSLGPRPGGLLPVASDTHILCGALGEAQDRAAGFPPGSSPSPRTTDERHNPFTAQGHRCYSSRSWALCHHLAAIPSRVREGNRVLSQV